MAITAKEIAKILGISPAAVSIAINNKPGVSSATRERVLQLANENGYEFSRGKNSDERKETISFILYKKSGGAVVDDTPFFSSLTEGVALSCREHGYALDIQYLFESGNVAKDVQSLANSGTSGVILLATEMKAEDFVPFRDLPLPMVVLDTYFEGLTRDCVIINNIQGAFLATNHLISVRKQPPGYLHSSYPIGNFEERADGFYKAVRGNGMSASQIVVHKLPPSVDGAYAEMSALLAKNVQTANCYFADNDLIAAGAMRAFKEHGYRIPQDVAFIGFDNTSLCELMDPPVTSVNVPKQAMGRLAVERLLSVINVGSSCTVKSEIMTSLVLRGSL